MIGCVLDPLYMYIGPRILDEVLTPLLSDLSSSSQRSEVALDGLKQVLSLSPPMSANGSITQVSSSSL